MIRKVIVGILFALGLTVALLSQNAQEIYQRALVQEQAAGKLPQAIELYLQAAKEAGKDRSLAAKALIRAAGAQEKLGKPEAANLYAEVVRTYPEQREQVQVAQARLAALKLEYPATSLGVGQAASNAARTDVSAVTAPLFEQYCIRCHNQTSRVANFTLDSLNAKNVGDNTSTWENILTRLHARRDPPAGLPRPDEKTYQTVISRLEAALDQAYPENNPTSDVDRATDAELATRMATFIWGGAPDALLLEDARQNKLHDPAVLDRQVQRMLNDPRSINLVISFFEPKFNLANFDKAKPDSAAFPQFDQSLQQSMATETRLFLDSQLRENHGALELWTANYSFLNERLAKHYGIPSISGNEFRRVTLPGSNRVGLLGQGSVLTVTSHASRTSPIVRGRWILEKFLGTEMPAPPPNVPPLANTPADQARPMAERMADHATNPACMTCHLISDPMGLSLENFDGIGQWRDTDGGAVINASGSFVDGSRFNGPAEMRTGLLKYRDAYYSNVTQQLLSYALGRKARAWGLHAYEMPAVYPYEMSAVRTILRAAAPDDYRWSAIISGIVKSAPFQKKTLVP